MKTMENAPKATNTYYVWRRDDGYISCIAHRPGDWGSGSQFEILLETSDWPKARAKTQAERDASADHQHILASWNGVERRPV